MAQVHHLTQAAFDRLQEEFDDLTGRGRIEVAAEIQRAREMGDLSENGDYQAAKDKQGMMEARIRHLESILKHCEIVERSDGSTVEPGVVVTLMYDGDDESDAEKFYVGSLEEGHRDLTVITPGSPLGKAIIGCSAGEWIEYQVKAGAPMLRVLVKAVEV
jgi:transcription elongation factor GreA